MVLRVSDVMAERNAVKEDLADYSDKALLGECLSRWNAHRTQNKITPQGMLDHLNGLIFGGDIPHYLWDR